MNLLKTVAVAFPLATWLTAVGIVVRMGAGGVAFDGSAMFLIVAAPVGVPLLILYGLGNWIDGFREENEVLWWCAGLLAAWVACFAAIHAAAARRLLRALER